MESLHLSQARRILNARRPVELTVATRSGEVQQWPRAVSGPPDRRGFRNMRMLASGQVRRLRDVCIIALDGVEVYL